MIDVDVTGFFAAGLRRHLDLAATLTVEDGEVVVPATPEWTVRDVYAHLAGLCTDALEGRLDGAATDPWTARQVAERAERSLADNVAELAVQGAAMADLQDRIPFGRIVIDQYTHEHDVRGALDRPGDRIQPVLTFAVAGSYGGRSAGWDAPTVRVVGSSGDWLLGRDDPVATFEATDFDLLRALLGRRSREQFAGWATPGSDPDAVAAAVARLQVFGPRAEPLFE